MLPDGEAVCSAAGGDRNRISERTLMSAPGILLSDLGYCRPFKNSRIRTRVPKNSTTSFLVKMGVFVTILVSHNGI